MRAIFLREKGRQLISKGKHINERMGNDRKKYIKTTTMDYCLIWLGDVFAGLTFHIFKKRRRKAGN